MAWSKAELMTWIAHCEARRSETLMDVLGVTESSSADALREAFHGFAKNAHPDLHKLGLTAEDYERLVRAYCRVSLAYATLRDPESKEKYMRELEAAAPKKKITTPPPRTKPPTAQPASTAAPVRTAVSSKAQIYVRKAEAALRQGDLATAQFNLRLAIASDPTSAALRASLADVEASLRK